MVDVSEAELTEIENAFEAGIQALAGDESPAATTLKEMFLSAQQIVSGKLDSSDEGGTNSPSTTDENLSASMQMPSMH